MATEDGYYESVQEFKEVDVDGANELLNKGWKAKAVKTATSMTPDGAVDQKIVYVMARVVSQSSPPTLTKPAVSPTKPLVQSTKPKEVDQLEKLPWVESKFGGKWISNENVPSWATAFLQAHNNKYEVDDIEYYLGKTGYISRRQGKERVKKA